MKTIISSLFMVITFSAFSQDWNQELRTMAAELAQQLSNKGTKLAGVADFTYNGQPNTLIGKYLADKLSGRLTATGVSIKDREEVRTALANPVRRQSSSRSIDEGTKENAKVLTNDLTTKDQKEAAAIDAGLDIMGELFRRPSNPLKDLDALVSGNVVAIGDNLELTVTIKKMNKKGEQIGYAETKFAKTPDLRDLIENPAPPVVATLSTVRTPNGTITTSPSYSSSSVTPFKHQNLTFEVIGCSQMGQTVECKLSILSSETNTNLTVHLGDTRFLNANGGQEFHVAEIKLVDASSTYYPVAKTIVADYPIEAIFRFNGVNRQISSISLLEINCNGFLAQFNNIPLH